MATITEKTSRMHNPAHPGEILREMYLKPLGRHKLIGELRADPQLARAYLAHAIEDDDPRVLLSALRTVAEMRGMARVAEAAGIPRESLYRTLSPKGNPRLSTLLAVIKAAGFRLSLDARKRRAA